MAKRVFGYRFVLLFVLCFVLAGQAGASSLSFNFILPKFGGANNTNLIVKDTTTASNYLQWTVGGGKSANYRTHRSDGTYASNSGRLATGSTTYTIYSSVCTVGKSCYLRVWNDGTTYVDVQVDGYWDLK